LCSRNVNQCAGAAGLAEALTMPVDFAKVRMQLQSSHCAVRYSGMVDCMASTLRNEGPRAFFKGLGPGLVRQMGYTGLSLMLYEPIRNGLSPAGTFLPSFVRTHLFFTSVSVKTQTYDRGCTTLFGVQCSTISQK